MTKDSRASRQSLNSNLAAPFDNPESLIRLSNLAERIKQGASAAARLVASTSQEIENLPPLPSSPELAENARSAYLRKPIPDPLRYTSGVLTTSSSRPPPSTPTPSIVPAPIRLPSLQSQRDNSPARVTLPGSFHIAPSLPSTPAASLRSERMAPYDAEADKTPTGVPDSTLCGLRQSEIDRSRMSTEDMLRALIAVQHEVAKQLDKRLERLERVAEKRPTVDSSVKHEED